MEEEFVLEFAAFEKFYSSGNNTDCPPYPTGDSSLKLSSASVRSSVAL